MSGVSEAVERGDRAAAGRDRVEELLGRVRHGDPDALDRLIPLVYDELRRVAHNWLRGERADISLGTTELVHETYIRLVDQTRVEWRDRVHFFGVASSLMRRILVDAARKRSRAKRGGGWARIDLEAADLPVEDEVERLLALDEALDKLGRVDDRLRRVVECRYFGGLTEDETAEVLGVTSRTVQRDWAKAKALLYSELSLRAPDASTVREG